MVGDVGAVIFIREYAGLGPGETNKKAGSAFLLVSPGPSPAYSLINITAPASPTTLHTSAYEDGTDRRFRNVGIYKPDGGELP
jgi:hypothetical protein